MKDEEKASIRDLLKTADINLSERQTNILCKSFEISMTKMYKQGLTEGRKEKCLEQNNDGTIRPCEVMKDNEQLKKQIEQLSNDNHILKTAFITQQEQIEKMKCC